MIVDGGLALWSGRKDNTTSPTTIQKQALLFASVEHKNQPKFNAYVVDIDGASINKSSLTQHTTLGAILTMFTQYNITIIKYFSFNNLHKILTNNNMTWPIDNKSKHYAPPTRIRRLLQLCYRMEHELQLLRGYWYFRKLIIACTFWQKNMLLLCDKLRLIIC